MVTSKSSVIVVFVFVLQNLLSTSIVSLHMIATSGIRIRCLPISTIMLLVNVTLIMTTISYSESQSSWWRFSSSFVTIARRKSGAETVFKRNSLSRYFASATTRGSMGKTCLETQRKIVLVQPPDWGNTMAPSSRPRRANSKGARRHAAHFKRNEPLDASLQSAARRA